MSDDDDHYDVRWKDFDDVTAFRRPESVVGNGRDYVRMYDREGNTLLYVVDEANGGETVLAVRDASDFSG
jgi:catabolite regulation protein CreA